MAQMIETPRIIRETSKGYDAYTILEDMLARLELECTGELNDSRFWSLARQLLWLQKEDPQREITLYLSGSGGSVSSALALYDVMSALSCPVRTVGMGQLSCPGALLLAAGARREVLPHTQINLYVGASSRVGMGEDRDAARQSRESAAELLCRLTARTREELEEALRADRWRSAQEGVELGLADQVVQRL